MKFLIYVFIILSFLYSDINSQSLKRIREESNPGYNYVQDNSGFAKLWRQMITARKNHDLTAYNNFSREIKSSFPERFQGTDVTNANIFKVINYHQAPPFQNDWINGSDLMLYAGSIGGQSAVNPNPFIRNVRLCSDSSGTQYAAFLGGLRDTLVVFSSTNNGNSWSRLFAILGSTSGYIHSFDMYATDSANAFRLGFAVSMETDGGFDFNGDIYWISLTNTASLMSITHLPKPVGRGLIGPSIVSDGYSEPAGSTYWYTAYQNCDTTTGITDMAMLALSTDWGRSWIVDTARATFNDYELDVDYNFSSDTIHVLLTNNLVPTNENLRLRYIALSDFGTNVDFKQFNPAETSSPERLGTLTANRQTNELAVMYTKVNGSNRDIYYSYSPNGYGNRFIVDQPYAANPNNEDKAVIKCQESQGVYRLCYVSSGPSFDTIIYSSSASLPVFGTRVVVNSNSPAPQLAPDVTGFRNGSVFETGVLFGGSANNNLYYDGSAAFVGITPVNNETPIAFRLDQNYPNPFNPSTEIEFSVPKDDFVSIKIFDLTGKESSILVNSNLKAGVYRVTFDGSKLTSGVYFYRMTSSSGFSETKKMILIK